MSNPTVGQFRAIWQGILDRLSGQAGKAQVQDADVKDAIDALRQVDFSTEAGQDAIKAVLDLVKLNTDSIKNKDFSTSAKQDLIVDVLDALKIDTTAIKGKDFATQTTLAQVKTELDLVKTELETIKANQLSGEQKVQLSGTKSVTHEVLLDAVSVAPLAQTNQINLNITNEKKVVLLVWNNLDTVRIWSSTPWRSIADADAYWSCLYPEPSHFSATPSYNPHVFVWIGTPYQRLGLTDIKEAFDIALPPVSPSFIRVSNDDPDKTLTITIRILRYWR